jgi:hypothetical protein
MRSDEEQINYKGNYGYQKQHEQDWERSDENNQPGKCQQESEVSAPIGISGELPPAENYNDCRRDYECTEGGIREVRVRPIKPPKCNDDWPCPVAAQVDAQSTQVVYNRAPIFSRYRRGRASVRGVLLAMAHFFGFYRILPTLAEGQQVKSPVFNSYQKQSAGKHGSIARLEHAG